MYLSCDTNNLLNVHISLITVFLRTFMVIDKGFMIKISLHKFEMGYKLQLSLPSS
jgi:hypothetical protein